MAAVLSGRSQRSPAVPWCDNPFILSRSPPVKAGLRPQPLVPQHLKEFGATRYSLPTTPCCTGLPALSNFYVYYKSIAKKIKDVSFDFSGIVGSDADEYVLADEGGTWKAVKATSAGQTVDFCLAQKPVSKFYVMVDNHGSDGGLAPDVTGSYTVTPSLACDLPPLSCASMVSVLFPDVLSDYVNVDPPQPTVYSESSGCTFLFDGDDPGGVNLTVYTSNATAHYNYQFLVSGYGLTPVSNPSPSLGDEAAYGCLSTKSDGDYLIYSYIVRVGNDVFSVETGDASQEQYAIAGVSYLLTR